MKQTTHKSGDFLENNNEPPQSDKGWQALDFLRQEQDKLVEKESSIDREISFLERKKEREKAKIKGQELMVEKRIEFVRHGGTQSSIPFLDRPHQKLQEKIGWYRSWHTNPQAPKVHIITASTVAFAVSAFLFAYIQLVPTFSMAVNNKPDKTASVATISSLKALSSKTISSEEQAIASLATDNVTVDFSNKSTKNVSAKIRSDDKNGNEKSIEFSLLQPSSTENGTSPVSSNNLMAHKAYAETSNKAKSPEESVQATAENVVKDKDSDNRVDITVNPSLDLKYELKKESGNTQVKETLIIKDKSALTLSPDYHIDFKINLQGLKVVQTTDGSYVLTNDDGSGTVMSIMPPVIEDMDKKTGPVTLSIAGDTATYTIDKNYADSAAYPLYLDPTVIISTSTTTNPNSFSKDRTLFEATNGDMINIYSAGSELDYKISSDHGNTWGAATKIIDSSTTDDTGFSGWITAGNKIHLVYSNNNTNSYIFYRQMTFDTATHAITSSGTEYTVESTGTSQAFPTVAVNPSNTIYVAYRYYDGSNYTVKVKASTATDGSAWAASTTLSAATNASTATYPAITLWNDNPAIIYNFANASIRWSYYSSGAWQTAGWTNEVISVEVGSALNQEFSISQQTSDGYLHLAWKDDSAGIRYKKLASASDSSKWDASSAQITSGGNHASDKNPSIGLGLNDAIYLYYSEYVGSSSYNIKYVEKVGSGSSFGLAIAVTTDNGNNLIAQGALKPTTITLTNQTNYSINLPATNSYYIGAASSPSISGSFSISLWLYRTGNPNGTNNVVFDVGNYGANNGFGIWMNASNQLGWRINQNYNTYKSSIVPTLNTWEHFVVVYDGSTVKMYKNAGTPTSDNYATNPAGATNYIRSGCRESNNECYNGRIDEVQIYNRALNSLEVTALNNSGTITGASTKNGLAAAWHMDENSGTTTADYSDNGYNLSFTGSPTWATASNQTISYSSSKNSYAPAVFVSGTGPSYNLTFAPTVKVWSAAADGNWETAGNWTPSGTPAAGDNVVFDATSVRNCTVTTYTSDNGIADGIGGIYVNSGYSGVINFQKKPSQNADSFKINITGDFIINSGTITSDSDLTVQHSGVTDGRGNEFVAQNLMIGAVGVFNTDGKGFAANAGPGRPTGSASGAYGGSGAGGGTSGSSYGDYSNPVSAGSGGASGAGGGAVIITASNSINVLGSLTSTGGMVNGTWDSYGGSGGSINMNAPVINGNGTITAIGGNPSGGRPGNGGGGGRIRLNAATSIGFSGTLSAAGGMGTSDGQSGGAGTVFKKLASQTYGDLIVDNGSAPYYNSRGPLGAHLKSAADNGSYQFDHLLFSNYGKLQIDPSQTLALDSGVISGNKNAGIINAGTITVPDNWSLSYFFMDKNGTIRNQATKNLTITNTGFLTQFPSTTTAATVYSINWSLASLTVQSGGEINVNNQGYSAGNGTGKPFSGNVSGSYGGLGAGSGTPGSTYGSWSNPVDNGSGGVYGAGAGAIIITVTGDMSVAGNITATGQDITSTWSSYGGSGGTVSLSAANITGGGIITALGANPTGGRPGLGGGGGRIKLSAANTISFNGTLSAAGGAGTAGFSGTPGSAGTVFKKINSQANGDLIIDNAGNSLAPARYTPMAAPITIDTLTVSNYGKMQVNVNADPVQDTLSVSGNVSVTSNSEIQLMSDNDGSPAKGTGITLSATNVSVASGCSINSDGTGFIHDSGYASGKGLVAATRGGGGAFGGAGGASNDGGNGGQVYGSAKDVSYIGSGGGAANLGGAGGGFMRLNVSGTLTNAGIISVNGAAGTTNGGGGSGGGLLMVVNSISSAGTISANGGSGAANAGGGGGGRIVAYIADNSVIAGATTTNGGTGASAGGTGTVFVQHSPASLVMNAPNDAATNQIQKTVLRFNSTDPEGDWVQYKVQLATDNAFTQNVSTFDQTASQNPTDGGRTAQFSNQDKTTGNVAGIDGYSSGREAVLTLQTDLTQNMTYYWRFYGYDPEGVDSFDGGKHWSAVSATRSFVISPIDHISFTTPQQENVVTFCSAVMTFNLRDVANNNMYLTANDGSKSFDLSSNSSGGSFFSDSDCHNALPGNQLTIGIGGNSANFFYKDSTPSAINSYWNITVAEDPNIGWTDGSQQIRIRPGDFGSFDVTGAPNSITAGNALGANNITVTIKDIFGNVKTDWTGQVWFYASDSQAVIEYNDLNKYNFTSGIGEDNGVHTFAGTGFTLKTSGNQSLVIHNSEGGQYDEVLSITVIPAAIDHFGLANYPRTATNKFAMSSFSWDTPGYSSAPYNPEVTAYDIYNNVADNFSGQVWFELYKSSDTPGNPANSTANYAFEYDYTSHYNFTSGSGLDNGIHSFSGSGFTVVTAASDLKLRVATDSNGSKYTDFTIKIKPQAIDHFSIEASPTISRNGRDWDQAVDTALTSDINVTAYDSFGNVKTDYAYDEATKSGMLYFYASDANAILPYYQTGAADSGHCFQFPSEAAGTYSFNTTNTPENYFKFLSGGYQNLTVSECIDPTSTYYSDVSSNRYDPHLDGVNPVKIAAAIGNLPENDGSPDRIFVSTHQPGSTHTALDHNDNSNDLIEAGPGHQQATLTWNNPFDIPSDPSLNPQAYIYRCDANCNDDSNYTKIVTTPAVISVTPNSQTEYIDTGLTDDTTYYYKLSYAYEREDSSYIESDKSISVSVTPADIAPRDVTATQLDINDSENPGKIKVEYKLRWDSTISLAYFDPNGKDWHNATSSSMSGDVGANVTGDENLIQHTAYFDPNVDFDGQLLNGTFKMRVKVTVGTANTYSDSQTFALDSKNPADAKLIVDASNLQTANLTLGATDDSSLMMKVSTNADFSGSDWQSIVSPINDFDIKDKSTIYVIYRDNFNNTTEVTHQIPGAPSNVSIKDGSNITSNNYRLLVIWDDVTPTPAHYNVQRSTDGKNYVSYDTTTKNAAIDINLDANGTYYYKVQAEDANGSRSPFSDPVHSSPGLAPDVTAPPKVELFGWKQDMGVRSKITWNTDQNSDSFVAYSKEELKPGNSLETVSGKTDNVQIVGEPALKTEHEIMLYNLDPSTKYYYKVLSKNEIQITGFSNVFDFTTPERILLTISGLKITDITNTGALVAWSTSKLSLSIVEYGSTNKYGEILEDKTLNTDHTFPIRDLAAGTYHLRVNATDSDGNITISDDYTFEIPETPVISSLAISEVNDNGAKVTWTTNVPTNSNVDIVSDGQSGSQGNGELTTTHSVTLVGLTAKTTYNIKARSIDKFGNTATSDTSSFTTTADLLAPKIIDPKSEISSTGSGDTIRYQLIVSWQTDEPATSKVEYGSGVGSSYESSSKEDLSLNMTHTIIVTDLNPNSVYHFRIKTGDKSNNIAYSEDYTVTTPPKEKDIVSIIINAIVGPLNDIYQGALNKLFKR